MNYVIIFLQLVVAVSLLLSWQVFWSVCEKTWFLDLVPVVDESVARVSPIPNRVEFVEPTKQIGVDALKCRGPAFSGINKWCALEDSNL